METHTEWMRDREKKQERENDTHTQSERLKGDLLDWLIGYSLGIPIMTILHWKESSSC